MHLSVHIPPYYSSVGSCNRLFFSGFCQSLVSDKRKSTPHFLILLTHHRGAYGFELQQIINSNYIVMQTKTVVGYLAPEIEVNFVVVEQGIAASNMEQLDIIYDEQEW